METIGWELSEYVLGLPVSEKSLFSLDQEMTVLSMMKGNSHSGYYMDILAIHSIQRITWKHTATENVMKRSLYVYIIKKPRITIISSEII